MSTANVVTVDMALDMLRQLPPRERLRVIAQALPEAERDLSDANRPLKSLRGLWKELGFDISAEEIDHARREAWANFPREDI
jgi:hypothetical protein